jgi:type I restriction enzyme, S subunit
VSEWREARLEDLCERITVGFVGKMSDQYVDNGIPFLRSQNIQPFRVEQAGVLYIGKEFHERIKKSTLRAGDVAVVRTGYPGTAAVIPYDLNESNCADLVVITPSADLNPHFLAAVFNSAWGKSHVNGQLVGSAQQHFNVGSAKAMEVRLPDRAGQDRIAEVLCSITDLIENNRRRIEVLEEMAQAIYREWFVRFRYPGHEDATFVDSPLGPIPEGWDVRPFTDIASFTNGFAFKPTHWGDTGRPIIKIKELKNGVTTATPRCNEAEIKDKYWIEPGDLLFSWSADLGVYRWTGEPGLLNQHLFVVKSSADASSLFIQHSLAGALPQFWDRAQGTTMRHIKRSALTEVTTTIPSIEIDRAFAERVGPIDALGTRLTQTIRELAAIRDLLLPKLVTGEIDVSGLDLDALVEAAP